ILPWLLVQFLPESNLGPGLFAFWTWIPALGNKMKSLLEGGHLHTAVTAIFMAAWLPFLLWFFGSTLWRLSQRDRTNINRTADMLLAVFLFVALFAWLSGEVLFHRYWNEFADVQQRLLQGGWRALQDRYLWSLLVVAAFLYVLKTF